MHISNFALTQNTWKWNTCVNVIGDFNEGEDFTIIDFPWRAFSAKSNAHGSFTVCLVEFVTGYKLYVNIYKHTQIWNVWRKVVKWFEC